MKDSIVVVGTHLTNYKSNLILTELINQLINEGFDYGIVANSLVCNTHYTNSKFFIYDSENDKLDETPSANFWFENDSFKIESPLLNYGAVPNYSFGATNLFINSVLMSKRYCYKYLHWVEYDSHLYVSEIEDNEKIFQTTDSSCVIYQTKSNGHPISGSFISVNLEKINLKNFFTPKDIRLGKLNEFGNSGEKFIKDFLLKNENVFYKKTEILSFDNKFNQARENPVEFVYYENNNKLFLFFKNNKKEELSFLLQTNIRSWEKPLKSFTWTIIEIGVKLELNYLFLTYNDVKLFINLNNKFDVEKYINRNKFYVK